MKIAIIGAGPAGLSAASVLSSLHQFEVFLFEKGKQIDDREHTNAEDLGVGIGGAGLFSDGKFSFYPSGTNVYSLEDKQLIMNGHHWLCEKLGQAGIESFPLQRMGDHCEAPAGLPYIHVGIDGNYKEAFHLKRYPSTYGSLEKRKNLIKSMVNENCRLFLNSDVKNIKKNGFGSYIINYKTDGEDIYKHVVVEGVIIATGRFGNLSIPTFMPNIKFEKKALRYDIGIRIETKSDIGFLSREETPDVKAIWKTPIGEVRTFCTCRNGEIWNIPYGNVSALSGRSDGPKSGYSNFGLLIRFSEDSFEMGEEYFIRIMNSSLIQNGDVGWQTLNSFLCGEDVSTTKDGREVYARPWFPKEKFKKMNLFEVVGKELYSAFKYAIEQLIIWSPDLRNSETMVLFPVIEGTGFYPKLTPNLKIDNERIWCIGDLSGLFRGIVPAFLSGYYVAQQAIRLEKQCVTKSAFFQPKFVMEGNFMQRIGVGVIIVKENKVLLGKRIGRHGAGTWSFPGGQLEDNESIVECAIRETREETGLEILNTTICAQTEDVFEEGQRYTTFFVLAECNNESPRVTEPEKFQEWEWFNIENLPTPLFTSIINLFNQGFNLRSVHNAIQSHSILD